jgi:hypothetical protein
MLQCRVLLPPRPHYFSPQVYSLTYMDHLRIIGAAELTGGPLLIARILWSGHWNNLLCTFPFFLSRCILSTGIAFARRAFLVHSPRRTLAPVHSRPYTRAVPIFQGVFFHLPLTRLSILLQLQTPDFRRTSQQIANNQGQQSQSASNTGMQLVLQ